MNILIVEDEIPTRRLLADMIKKIKPAWKLTGTTGSLKETIDFFRSHPQPDLIFMDIQLSDGSSFELFKQVDIKSPVIFTTAYDEYAIQAFKVNSIDYLLKPVNEKKLEEAISKYERFFSMQQQAPPLLTDYQSVAEMVASGRRNYRIRLLVNLPDGFQKLDVKNIAWFVSSNKITTAFTFEGQHHIIDFTLDKLDKELDPMKFFRVNRQYILNIETIHKVENWFNGKLIVKTRPENKEKIVVSREKAKSFKEWINQ
ncbi:LytR/AlgR family response regulator transcription factor [Anaerophaga thermohalophila]|uniref:LytR/AlgR family response regulator transcription factor n=1 Tax=Anaerophaga thermohalophila TaxID=177400 RepID=UPI000237C215|nr:LytTR family DNA-binding domain-containing protein [Anaerophaga thermohalophila]